MKRKFPESELIINADGSCFHLHLKPEFLADKVISKHRCQPLRQHRARGEQP